MRTKAEISIIIYNLLNVPIHKLKYAIRTNLIEGMFLTLSKFCMVNLLNVGSKIKNEY